MEPDGHLPAVVQVGMPQTLNLANMGAGNNGVVMLQVVNPGAAAAPAPAVTHHPAVVPRPVLPVCPPSLLPSPPASD